MKAQLVKSILFKYADKNNGLTLIEVLVATIIVVLFIGITLQALTVAAVFQSRAKVQNDVISWIQEDLEQVRENASAVAVDNSKCKATDPSGGYAKQLEDNLPTINPTTKQISGLDHEIVRTPTIMGSDTCQLGACYEILHLKYQVKGTGARSSVVLGEIDTEVIPDAAFQCQL